MTQQQAQEQVVQKSSQELDWMLILAQQGKEQDFSHQDLSGMNLSGLKLMGSKFINANLSGCNLNATNLAGCDLSGANLSGADLYDGYLENANLSGADLSGADLSENFLDCTNLSGANLSNVKFHDCVILPSCNWDNVNLEGAYYGFDDRDLPEEKIYMTRPPVIFFSKTKQGHPLYRVMILDKFIQIGCQIRPYKEWLGMGLDEMEELDDSDGLMFNKLHRQTVIQLAEQHNCSKD
ncbi:MAG TPA: pentapeptide repeat-containing protein [Phormidium sp.]